jgi:hypothetical protein
MYQIRQHIISAPSYVFNNPQIEMPGNAADFGKLIAVDTEK